MTRSKGIPRGLGSWEPLQQYRISPITIDAGGTCGSLKPLGKDVAVPGV